MSKTYFWLKLKDDFFKSKEIKKLRKIAGGDTYTIIYLKLQLLSLKNDCIIKFDETENDIYEQLELELDEDINNIKITISFLQANNLIEIQQNDVLMLSTVENVGMETDFAIKKREYRERLKQDKEKTLIGQCPTEKEIDIEIEKDIKENNIKEIAEQFKIRWNEFAVKNKLSKIETINNDKLKQLEARIKQAGDYDTFCNIINDNWHNSKFLRGETNVKFLFKFNFILQKSSFSKMIDKDYYDKEYFEEQQ